MYTLKKAADRKEQEERRNICMYVKDKKTSIERIGILTIAPFSNVRLWSRLTVRFTIR